MVESYALHIARQLAPHEFERLLSHVSEERQGRIRRFLFFTDAQRALLGELLARYAVHERSGIHRDRIRFGLNPDGKPVLVHPDGLCFNISHAGDWVVCALDHDPVGIDVENIKPFNPGIAERFFSPEEYLELVRQKDDAMIEYFYRIWTLKESYVKMIGKGLNTSLSSFTIRISGDAIMLRHDREDGHPPTYFHQEKLMTSFLAISARNKLFSALKFVRLDDLIQNFSGISDNLNDNIEASIGYA
ncbi:MAG: 4'-phosphopantetheinyl transferase family protein [Patescibacteria group bacterium]